MSRPLKSLVALSFNNSSPQNRRLLERMPERAGLYARKWLVERGVVIVSSEGRQAQKHPTEREVDGAGFPQADVTFDCTGGGIHGEGLFASLARGQSVGAGGRCEDGSGNGSGTGAPGRFPGFPVNDALQVCVCVYVYVCERGRGMNEEGGLSHDLGTPTCSPLSAAAH